MTYLSQVAEPSVYPLTLDEVKSWCRVDDTNSDADIQAILQAATKLVEQNVNRPLISRQYDLVMDTFPSVIELPLLPVSSVDSITYYDTDNALQTLSSALYKVSLGSNYTNCRVQPAVNQNWPNLYDDLDVVTVRFTAGYGTSWNDVPQSIRSAILYICADMFEGRCSTTETSMHGNPTAMALLQAERLPR